MADFQPRQVLGERYQGLQPVLPRDVALDDPKESALLEQVARSEEVKELVDGAGGWVCRVGCFQSGSDNI